MYPPTFAFAFAFAINVHNPPFFSFEKASAKSSFQPHKMLSFPIITATTAKRNLDVLLFIYELLLLLLL